MHETILFFVAAITTSATEKHPINKTQIESTVSADSATEPPALLSTLLDTPQYLNETYPPSTKYFGPL